jgi:hypothetical protein
MALAWDMNTYTMMRAIAATIRACSLPMGISWVTIIFLLTVTEKRG